MNLRGAKKHKCLVLALGLFLVLLVGLAAVLVGTVSFSGADFVVYLQGLSSKDYVYQIIHNVRIPRILSGMLIGMNLAVAGVLLQGVLRNPMASPNIIGVNAGAGLFAVMLMTVFPSKLLLLPLFAFLGALLASLLIYAISSSGRGPSSTVHIVLAGVAVSAFLSSLTSGFMMLNSDVLDVTYSWMLGSLSGRSWSAVQMVLPYSLLGLFLAMFFAPKLNLFSLGDEMASSVGLRIGLFRIFFIGVAAVLAGSAVSAAGAIGFVGLVAPHTARLIIGNDHRYLIPLSALLGALLLVISDTLARTIFQPVELSVGIVTGVIGAPFFLMLLKKHKNSLS